MSKKVAVIGSVNFDIMLSADRLPMKGETYTVDNVNYCPGGKGINQAFQCAKLGADTYFYGCFSKDLFGEYLFNNIKNENLNMDKVKRVDCVQGMGIVNIINDGSVHANIYPGSNDFVDLEYIKSHISDLKAFDYIILQLEIPTRVVEYIIEFVQNDKTKIILNAAPAKDINFNLLKKIDTLIVNEVEAEYYIGKKLDTLEDIIEEGKNLRDKLNINLIITIGEKGSVLFIKDKFIKIEPVITKNVVDTTGAGDSFIGAFVFALQKGYDYTEACNFGSLVASKTITKIGAQSAMPNFEEVYSGKGVKIK